MSESSGLFASCLCCQGSPPEERKSKKKEKLPLATDKETKSNVSENPPVKTQPKDEQTVIANWQPPCESIQPVRGAKKEVVRNGAAKKDSVDLGEVVLEDDIDADMAANLSELVTRLEKVTSRLESVASSGGSSGGGGMTDTGRTWLGGFLFPRH